MLIMNIFYPTVSHIYSIIIPYRVLCFNYSILSLQQRLCFLHEIGITLLTETVGKCVDSLRMPYNVYYSFSKSSSSSFEITALSRFLPINTSLIILSPAFSSQSFNIDGSSLMNCSSCFLGAEASQRPFSYT